jgi:hypothetical protein
MSQFQDAQLILHFYELRREARLREARAFVGGPFKAKDLQELNELCPPGSDENAFFRQVTSYWDMLCSIVKRHLVDKELFFETNGELTIVWEKTRHLVPGLREAYGNPQFLANLELIAGEREVYLEQKTPGYLKALRQRLGVVKP